MSSPLIEQLVEQYHYPRATADNLTDLLDTEKTLALFFTEDPKRYPESNDVAVILPELAKAFPEQFSPVVVDRELEPELKARYAVNIWPTIVFIRQGRFLGKLSKVMDWSDYMERIPEILNSESGAQQKLKEALSL